MKNLMLIFLMLLTVTSCNVASNAIPEGFVTAIGVALGIYEVLARVIPTSKTWSIIGNILNFLKKISDGFDSKNNSKLHKL